MLVASVTLKLVKTMKGHKKEEEYENKNKINGGKNGIAQEVEIREVARRKYKMRKKNKKNISRKLEKVSNCENCVENGKGEKRGKGKK
jgi:hypothetical protein